MSPGRHNLRFVSYDADRMLTLRLLFLDWKQSFVRLPSGSSLGQSSVGLVYAMRRPLSDEPTRVRQEAQANKQLMYLYFTPFHHLRNLGAWFYISFFCFSFLLFSALFENAFAAP